MIALLNCYATASLPNLLPHRPFGSGNKDFLALPFIFNSMLLKLHREAFITRSSALLTIPFVNHIVIQDFPAIGIIQLLASAARAFAILVDFATLGNNPALNEFGELGEF